MKRTTTEAELREMCASGRTVKSIADELGHHRNNIYVALDVLGIQYARIGSRPQKRPDQAALYLEGIKSGMTLGQIAQKHGKSTSGVNALLRSHGLPTSARAYLKWSAEQANKGA